MSGPQCQSNSIEPINQAPPSELVGDTGIEPVTSSVSGKRSPAELIALRSYCSDGDSHRCEVGTGFEPVYTALQAVASPLGHPTAEATQVTAWTSSSGRRDSNPRPSPWQGDALPTALRPLASRPWRAARPGNCIRTCRCAPNRPPVSEFRRRSACAEPGGLPNPSMGPVIFAPLGRKQPAGAGGDGLPPPRLDRGA